MTRRPGLKEQLLGRCHCPVSVADTAAIAESCSPLNITQTGVQESLRASSHALYSDPWHSKAMQGPSEWQPRRACAQHRLWNSLPSRWHRRCASQACSVTRWKESHGGSAMIRQMTKAGKARRTAAPAERMTRNGNASSSSQAPRAHLRHVPQRGFSKYRACGKLSWYLLSPASRDCHFTKKEAALKALKKLLAGPAGHLCWLLHSA